MERTTPTLERVDEWVGEELYSSDGEQLGSVDEVLVDTETREPEWFALTSGLLGRTRRLVPIAGADRREDGVHVPYTAEQVAQTPEIEGREVSQETERALYGSYGLPYSERRSATGLPERPRGRRTPSTSKRSSTQTRPSGRASDEPTRDELYVEAKRLGIEGRSKMNKAELARAVGRARGRATSPSRTKANPIEVQKFLEGVGYPTRKPDLVKEARSQGASNDIRATLERLPNEEFASPTEVSEAIGRLG